MCICVQDLCIRQAHTLNVKSSMVEEATNELINLLMQFDHNQSEREEKAEGESSTESKSAESSEGILTSFWDPASF